MVTTKENVEFMYTERLYKHSQYKTSAQVLEYLYVLLGYEVMETSQIEGNTVRYCKVFATFCWDDALEIPIFTFEPDYPRAQEATKRQEILLCLLRGE